MPKTMPVARDIFHPLYLDLFWQMIAERQLVWYRRSFEKMDPPWTDDVVMQSEFITNVYRELDPGTIYVVNDILNTSEHPTDKIFNVMVFRLMGSQIETHKHAGFQKVKNYDAGTFYAILQEFDKHGGKIFGDAYRVAPYQDEGGQDKADNVSRLLGKIADDFSTHYKSMQAASSSQELWAAINGIRGLGDFLAFQIMVDLLYPIEMMNNQPMFPFTHDDWAVAGPGAKNGIKQLMLPDVVPASYYGAMRWLADNMQAELERLKLPFVYLQGKDGGPKRLHVTDIQSCLCEFYKYSRIWNGSSRAVRKFKPSTPASDLQVLSVVTEANASDVERISHILPGTDRWALTPPIPSAAEHELLVRSTIAGGEELDGVARGLVTPGNAVGGQLPANYAAQLAQAALVGELGQGVPLDDNQPRLVLVDPLHQFGDDVPYALMIIPIAKSRSGVAVPQNLEALSTPAPEPDHAGTGDAEVQS